MNLIPAAAPLCRHCQTARANRPRGLCWHCYYSPGIRELYPMASGSRDHGAGLGNGTRHRPPPAEATQAPPGTVEKLETMMRRAENDEQLFHESDAKEE